MENILVYIYVCMVYMEEGRSIFKILTGKPTGNRALGSLGVNGETILEWR